jgi:hypothetical protein
VKLILLFTLFLFLSCREAPAPTPIIKNTTINNITKESIQVIYHKENNMTDALVDTSHVREVVKKQKIEKKKDIELVQLEQFIEENLDEWNSICD